MAMNVYDFDGTIYDGDSTIDFFLFALKHKPSLLWYGPKQAWGFFLYGLKKISKTELKEYFFSFLSGIDAEKMTEAFWDKNHDKIYKWYLDQKQSDDIIISASPEFLLKPICRRLEIRHLIASKVNAQSGKFDGKNCRGEEKVLRLAEVYQVSHVDNFYSDTHSDLPLAEIADKAFLVDRGMIKEWKVPCD